VQEISPAPVVPRLADPLPEPKAAEDIPDYHRGPAVTLLTDPTDYARLSAGYDQAVRARRLATFTGLAVLAVLIVASGWMAEIRPAVFVANLSKFASYLGRIFVLDSGQVVFRDVAEWFWGLKKWSYLILETILVAYLGTLIGAIGAFFLSFLAARNLAGPKTVFGVRRVLEFCRTVPEIVFAMIFVVAFGLGPLPGVLALAIHTMGALGKLFFEATENVDMKPVDGVRATGASWPATVRFAVLPQVMSNFISYTLLRFEINVREAGIMGAVGAGGIGQDLLEAVRKFYYSDVSAILILIIVTVSLIDFGTERLRHRLINLENGR
jgi:phosphonate transport system permease protein